jgi:[acyl-carrier-protein] S-malonyltransferase
VAEIRQELKAQLTAPVRWTGSMTHLLDQGVDRFVEVGPGEVLLGLMKRISRNTERIKFRIEE